MTRQARMLWFQVRQFARVPYFTQVMLVATMSVTIVQALAFHVWGGNCSVGWLRGGVIGMWTTCTSAAGILGFERYKGTLVHLFLSRIHPLRTLASVVGAASVFALASFPVAWATGMLAQRSFGSLCTPSVVRPIALAAQIALLWIACLSVTFVVSAIFVLTPNAIAYEELLIQPVLIASGVLFTLGAEPGWLRILGTAIPLREPVRMLMTGSASVAGVALGLGVSAAWFVLATVLGRLVLRRARVMGTVEVI